MQINNRGIHRFTLAISLILFLAVAAIYAKRLPNLAPKGGVRKVGVSQPSIKAAAKATIHDARVDRLARAYGLLPLSFETNKGQTDSSVEFISHGTGYTLFLRRNETVIELQRQDEANV